MAYGKYRHAEISGQAGTTWYVEIWRKDWAGSSSVIDLHGEGFEVRWTGEGGTRDRQYITSECIIKCNIQNSTDEDFMYDIFSKGDRRYFVRVYKNAISDAGIWWFGWVQPSFSQFENFPFPYQSYITAADSIGTYSKQPESSLTAAETATANPIIEHIKDFGDDSGIYNVTADSGVNNNAPARDNQDWIYTSVDWWRDGDSYLSDDPFSLYRISKFPFITDPEKFPNRYHKYKVLQESLKTFNTVGLLSDGRYNFIQPNNYKGNTSGNLTFYKYDKGDEADTPSSEVEDNLLIIDGTTNANRGVVMGGGTSTYEPPYNSVTANYSFGSAQIVIIPNADYSSYTFVGDMQNDPSAPDSAHLNLNLNLYYQEVLSESLVIDNLNTLSATDPSLQGMHYYSQFYWQVKITDGTTDYYLTHSTTSDRYRWVTSEPTNRLVIGYPPGAQISLGSDPNYPAQFNSSNSVGPCNMEVQWPNINLSSRKRVITTWGSLNVEADLPPITGQVHVKLTGERNVYYYNYDNGTYAGGVSGPINPGGTSWPGTDPYISSLSVRTFNTYKYDTSVLSNINDSEGSLSLTDEGEGLKFVANQTTVTAEEDFQLGDLVIGQSGSESVNVNCIQYLNGTTPESVTSGFRRGNSGGFLNPTQLLCNEFLELQVEPLEILQADIFSPDISPIKLVKYSINGNSNFNYYSFLGGTFKAQSETMSGEWFKIDNVNYTISAPNPEDTIAGRPPSEGNENRIDNVEKSIRYFDSINSIGETNADIVSGSSINKINFSGTSSSKVYNDQKLYLRHSLAPNGLVVTVAGETASGASSIDIDAITPSFPIIKGAKLFVIPSDLTNVITGGSGGAQSINDLTDVDTAGANAPSVNDVLKWNGSDWIPAVYNATFTFSVQYNRISTPNYGTSSSQKLLIGSASIQFQSSLVHSIAYNNGGTFTTAPTVNRFGTTPGNSVTGGYPLTTTSNGSTATSSAINYPSSLNYSSNSYAKYQFRVNATFGGTTDYNGPDFNIYFRNKKFYGLQAAASLTSSEIIALSSNWMSNSNTGTDNYLQSSLSLSPSDQYIYYCYPSRISGTPVFKINGFGTGFTSLTDVSVTNASGYVETYKVFQSPLKYNGSLTFIVE